MISPRPKLDPKKTALIVVDMQNGFLDDNGFMNKMGMPITYLKPVLPKVKRLIGICRGVGIPVIYTRFVLRPDYADAGIYAMWRPRAKESKTGVAGTWDVDIHKDIAPQPNDYIVNKQRASAFYNTNMEIILRGLQAEAVLVCGVTTEVCVESTVRDAFFRDYWVVVVKDAVAAADPQRHEGSLRNIEYGFGTLATVAGVAAMLRAIPEQ